MKQLYRLYALCDDTSVVRELVYDDNIADLVDILDNTTLDIRNVLIIYSLPAVCLHAWVLASNSTEKEI